MKALFKDKFGDKDIKVFKDHLTTDWEIIRLDQAQSKKQFEEADVVFSGSWDKDVPPAPNMKLLQVPWTGYDSVEMNTVPKQACICNVFEHEVAISEYVLLAMLEWQIGLRKMDAQLREGDWQSSFKSHGKLQGKIAGIIGYGHIGREIAKRLKIFGVRVLARTRSPEKTDEYVDEIDSMSKLDSMLAECDFLIVTCPLTEQTREMLGKEQLAKMKNSAVIVNVARGAIFNEEALFNACKDKTIAGAVIDTWYSYPPWGSKETHWPSKFPFQDLDNLIMSPHCSAITPGLSKKRWQIVAENLNRLARGEELMNLIRKGASL